jgi:hypothetical protein
MTGADLHPGRNRPDGEGDLGLTGERLNGGSEIGMRRGRLPKRPRLDALHPEPGWRESPLAYSPFRSSDQSITSTDALLPTAGWAMLGDLAQLDDFRACGEVFKTRRPSRSHVIAEVRQLDHAEGAERLRRMDAIVRLFLTDQSRARWATLRERHEEPVTLGMLTEVIEWLVSAIAPEVAHVAEEARRGFVRDALRVVGTDETPSRSPEPVGCSWRPRTGRAPRGRRGGTRARARSPARSKAPPEPEPVARPWRRA